MPNRVVKFDIISKHPGSDELHHDVMTLEEIEQASADEWDYEIVARRQCTDVVDCDGTELFEGDVVDRMLLRGVISFSKGSFILEHRGHCVSNLSAWQPDRLKKIGNIYDNPALEV